MTPAITYARITTQHPAYRSMTKTVRLVSQTKQFFIALICTDKGEPIGATWIIDRARVTRLVPLEMDGKFAVLVPRWLGLG